MHTNIKHIHFTGIKGVGMTPLAVIAKEAGKVVTGSDSGEIFITDAVLEKAGINSFDGFSESHITGADLVITTGAHGGYDNIEVKAAREQNIPVITQGEAVGVFMDGTLFGRQLKGISIAGTHGKTTTTALVATVLREAGLDPSFVVGTGDIPSLGGAGHYGSGEYFVAEADEYATEPKYDKTTKFLWQRPTIAVFTNIELDHPDLYNSVEDMQKVFLQFAKQLPPEENGGLLIAFGDDHRIQQILKEYSGRVKTYGFSPNNDFIITRFVVSENKTSFWATLSGVDAGEFVLNVTGEHNVLNAAATILVALEAGMTIEECRKALLAFHGTKRRLEKKGQLGTGALLYDDYAHHPTEIKKSLGALSLMYPDKDLICIFQPHTYSRTKALFTEFVHCFTDADTLFLTDIFASARENADTTVSSEVLSQEVKKIHKNVFYLPSLSDVIEYLNEKQYKKDCVIVTMGAGDVYKIANSLNFK